MSDGCKLQGGESKCLGLGKIVEFIQYDVVGRVVPGTFGSARSPGAFLQREATLFGGLCSDTCWSLRLGVNSVCLARGRLKRNISCGGRWTRSSGGAACVVEMLAMARRGNGERPGSLPF